VVAENRARARDIAAAQDGSVGHGLSWAAADGDGERDWCGSGEIAQRNSELGLLMEARVQHGFSSSCLAVLLAFPCPLSSVSFHFILLSFFSRAFHHNAAAWIN
jgi:hypothetical protein